MYVQIFKSLHGRSLQKGKRNFGNWLYKFYSKKAGAPTPAFCIYFARYVFYSEYINLHEAS